MTALFPNLAPDGRIVVLTGAGISKESGLYTFRDADGIWARHDLEDVATPQGFARNPGLVHRFYNARRRKVVDPAVRPNAAHRALARLEREWPGDFLLVSQNVDDLHIRAGSRKLIAMHGELLKVRCGACGYVAEWLTDVGTVDGCGACGTVGALRPDIVWFGEMPFETVRIHEALARCDLFMSIGTSGNVYPAAGFVHSALDAGAHTVELNLEPSAGSRLFDEAFHGPATEIVPAFVERILGGRASQSEPSIA